MFIKILQDKTLVLCIKFRWNQVEDLIYLKFTLTFTNYIICSLLLPQAHSCNLHLQK